MKKKNYFFNLKGLVKFCLLLAVIFLSGSVLGQDVSTGLKFHYDFEGISGTTIPDVSGNNLSATIQGAATAATGKSGQGLLCTVKADNVLLPADINVGVTSFTYSAWVNFSLLKSNTRLLDIGNADNGDKDFFAIVPSYNADNGYLVARYRPATGTAQMVTSTTKCSVGTWTHVAVTYAWNETTSTGTLTVYINGAKAGSTANLTFTLNALGTTSKNYIAFSRWLTNDTNGLNAIIDDVRFYDRALTGDEVLVLNGMPSSLISAYNNLALSGDLSKIQANLTLPTTSGDVQISWASSNTVVVANDGTVTRPSDFDAPAVLTATLTQTVNGETFTLIKKFNVTVLATTVTDGYITSWNFKDATISQDGDTVKVMDETSKFNAKLMNEARIRTIGTNEKFNVLDLGNGTGYLDMGKEIGKAIYSLRDYTMSGYFRIDEGYSEINSNGNFYWTFSNTQDAMNDRTGYIIGSLKAQSQSVATDYYALGNQAVGKNANAALGGWHHFAYTQEGEVGTVYVDGEAFTGPMTNLPVTALPRVGYTGTIYNWLGRSNYVSDVYLRKTLLYGFKVFNSALSSTDLNEGGYSEADGTDAVGITEMRAKLDQAYTENPDVPVQELIDETANLTLVGLDAVASNLTLPSRGTNTNIRITWKSSNNSLIDGDGVVTCPNFYASPDTLTAILSLRGRKMFKVFPAVVLPKPETVFTGDLLVKHDFATIVNDSVVADASEQHLKATLKDSAKIETIGLATKFNVLSLGDSIGCLDLGSEIGQLIYHLNDYTMSAYYRVDVKNTNIAAGKNGSFLWTFTNTMNPSSIATGYIFAGLNAQSMDVSSANYASPACQSMSYGSPALTGGFHHFAYTQSGTTGTIYIDGVFQATKEITNLPSIALSRAGKLGTLYNYIGRSCYPGDIDLRNTMVYDFRLYKKALTEDEIANSVYNVGTKIVALDKAYNETYTGLTPVSDSSYKVIPGVGVIRITGLTGVEKISVCDVAGRQIKMINSSEINVNAGVYVVRINGFVEKVIVR